MRDAPETRHSLLARLHGSDSDVAWVEFMKLYEPAIYRFARRQGLQDADAHEVVQEVLLSVRALASNPSHARREKFRAWLSTVTRNRIIDLVRKVARKEKATAQLIDRAANDEDSLQFEVRHQMFVIASKVVQQKVSSAQWQAFWKSTIESIPPTKVAEQLGVSVGSVYVSRCRVMEKLRIEIDRMTREDLGEGERAW